MVPDGVGGVQDEARWAITDTGRERNGRKMLRSAGDMEDVRSPLPVRRLPGLSSKVRVKDKSPGSYCSKTEAEVQEDGNVPQKDV